MKRIIAALILALMSYSVASAPAREKMWVCTDSNGHKEILNSDKNGACKELDLPAIKLEARPVNAVNFIGFVDMSCGEWGSSANFEARRAQYLSWLRGFATGYNFGTVKGQISFKSFPGDETLVMYVDKYCRDYPLRPFLSAAFSLIKELPHETPLQKK